jgi:hypothetical protein
MHYICATVASTFILRRCAPVTLFVYQARRLFEKSCRTGAGAITPSKHARQCSNSSLAVVGAFHFARKSIAWDFRIFVNKIDAWLHFILAKVRNLVRTFVEECTIVYVPYPAPARGCQKQIQKKQKKNLLHYFATIRERLDLHHYFATTREK